MIIFVSDIYAEEYVGGAELSTEALINYPDFFGPIIRLKSEQVTKKIMESYSKYHWVFTNTSMMKKDCYIEAIKNLSYSVVEFDYKFCSLRSIEKHILTEGECLCHTRTPGKLFSVFLAKAKGSYFMSEKQRQIYLSKFPFLRDANTHVLSSVFTNDIIEKIDFLNDNVEKTEDSFIILKSSSWVKGTIDTIKYADEHGINYEVVGDLPYQDLLKKLRQHKGLIFHPSGADTCPRLVIEALLLGCELDLNDNVQHKDEDWFSGTIDDTKKYLLGRPGYFWKNLYNSLEEDTNIPRKTQYQDQKYIFIVPTYNSQKWIERTLYTITQQNCQNFECFIGDDLSTDETSKAIENFMSNMTLSKEKFTVVKNTKKKYALENIHDLIQCAKPSDEDIIVMLDGDDWLSNPFVLDVLNETYSDDTLMTFGSFIEYPTARLGTEASAYPEDVIKGNLFRKDLWRASHLKTLKYKVWKDIDKEDFKNKDGSFFDSAYDQAIMLPALEISGEHAKYIPKVTCVYNVGNPNAVVRDRQEKQHNNMLEIRSKKVYDKKAYNEHTSS